MAQVTLRSAIELNPEPLFQAHLGWLLFVQSPNKAHRAIKYIKDAVARQTSLALGYEFLGTIFFYKGRIGQARRWWQLCLSQDPNNVAANQGLLATQQTEQDWGPLDGMRTFTSFLFFG